MTTAKITAVKAALAEVYPDSVVDLTSGAEEIVPEAWLTLVFRQACLGFGVDPQSGSFLDKIAGRMLNNVIEICGRVRTEPVLFHVCMLRVAAIALAAVEWCENLAVAEMPNGPKGE